MCHFFFRYFRHGFFLSEYFDVFDLQNAIAGISYEYGNTNTAAGLRLVREHYFNNGHGDRMEIQNFREFEDYFKINHAIMILFLSELIHTQ